MNYLNRAKRRIVDTCLRRTEPLTPDTDMSATGYVESRDQLPAPFHKSLYAPFTHCYRPSNTGLNIGPNFENLQLSPGLAHRCFLKQLRKRDPHNPLVSCLAKKTPRDCRCGKLWPDNGYQSSDSLSEGSQDSTTSMTTSTTTSDIIDECEVWSDEEDEDFTPSPVDDELLAALTPVFDPHAMVFIEKAELKRKNVKFDRNHEEGQSKPCTCYVAKRKSVHWKAVIETRSIYIESFSFLYSKRRTIPLVYN